MSQGTLDAIYSLPSLINLLEAGRWDAAEDKLATRVRGAG